MVSCVVAGSFCCKSYMKTRPVMPHTGLSLFYIVISFSYLIQIRNVTDGTLRVGERKNPLSFINYFRAYLKTTFRQPRSVDLVLKNLFNL